MLQWPGVPELTSYVWVVFIAGTLLNAAVWWWQGRTHMSRDPNLAPGYRRLAWGLVFWGSIPWLMMAAGLLTGGVDSPSDYLKPYQANP